MYKHILQAYGSALVGSKLQIDLGKFVSPLGAEVIRARDDWNYTRSLLFVLAIPYYHVGLRASLPVDDKVSLAGWLVNGWNNSTENNSGKSVGFGGTVKPTASLTWVANVMYGPEQPNNDHDKRLVVDTTLTWTATPKLSLMANYDYGQDTYSGVGVSWQGLAVYGRFQATSWWALVGRYEWLNDDDAFMTGTPQKLQELTITSEQKVGPLITRLEYRRDHSSTDFFQTDGGTPSPSQNTFVFGAIVNFGGKI